MSISISHDDRRKRVSGHEVSCYERLIKRESILGFGGYRNCH